MRCALTTSSTPTAAIFASGHFLRRWRYTATLSGKSIRCFPALQASFCKVYRIILRSRWCRASFVSAVSKFDEGILLPKVTGAKPDILPLPEQTGGENFALRSSRGDVPLRGVSKEETSSSANLWFLSFRQERNLGRGLSRPAIIFAHVRRRSLAPSHACADKETIS